MSVPETAPLTRDGLIARFHTYEASPDRMLVGAELERHLLRPDGTPVPYFGDHGVRWLLERLAATGGWEVHREGEYPIELVRNGASVTLEPGSQFELSGAPHPLVQDVEAEALSFAREVDAVIADAPIRQVALGFTPFARIEDISWVPKGRYVLMREHLGRTGQLAHYMMKGTCAVQASFDFWSEEDCARKVALSSTLGPLTTAMFANSPLTAGQPNGFKSFRGHIWTQTDPRRTGFPQAAEGFSYEAWVDYLLDVPMMFLFLDGAWRAANGRTFREWMQDGIDGVFPTEADWNLHQTSVFPEVRVKRQIEVRGADCVPLPLAMSFCALFKGLFYCARAMDEAESLAARFRAAGTKEERFDVACRTGLDGEIGGRRLADWAGELVQLAADGIARCEPRDRPYLDPLLALVERGVTPADDVLAAWKRDPTPEGLLDACAYLG